MAEVQADQGILAKSCGYESWDDVPYRLKKSMIAKFPSTHFPDWNSVEMDELSCSGATSGICYSVCDCVPIWSL